MIDDDDDELAERLAAPSDFVLAHAHRRLDRLERQTAWLTVSVVVEALALIIVIVGAIT